MCCINFIDIADFIAIGGAMANVFLLAQGIRVAKSTVDRDEIPVAKDIMDGPKPPIIDWFFIYPKMV